MHVHRYCTGVACHHYSELTIGTNPFVCQFCALKTYGALIKQLQSEVRRLKFELASTKATLSEHTQIQRDAQTRVEAKTVNQLQSDFEEIKIELAGTKATPLKPLKLSCDTQRGKVTSPDTETLPLSYAVVASARGGKPSKFKSIAHPVPRIISDKKYNLVLYGVKEC